MLQETEVVDQLCRSTVYQDFERAFCEVTQYPLRLSPPKNRSLVCNGKVNGHHFSSSTDVPVRLGDKIIGVLQVGRPALVAARAEYFKDSEKTIRDAGESLDFERICNADIDALFGVLILRLEDARVIALEEVETDQPDEESAGDPESRQSNSKNIQDVFPGHGENRHDDERQHHAVERDLALRLLVHLLGEPQKDMTKKRSQPNGGEAKAKPEVVAESTF